jgi:pimeloyl-ACP methyl ester carboxylesterase
MRRVLTFACEGETLVGTLDEADGATGLLIVSGGNEIRCGAHRGMALLAARLAGRGHPVFRYDRRGVGDSSGENAGWSSGSPDLHAASSFFRVQTSHVKRLIALGNCDAAAALVSFGREAGIDAAILTNPWLGIDGPQPAAVRARYADRLRDPRSWLRPPDPIKLFKGLRALAVKPPRPALARLYVPPALPTTVILAERDATALQYRATVGGEVVTIPTASHSFADAADEFEAAVVAALELYSAA